MRIIEILTLENGAHRNQSWSDERNIPEGWAAITDEFDTPNFPFGEVVVEDVVHYEGVDDETRGSYTVPTVKYWTSLPIPEPEEMPKPITELEQLRADVDYIAMETGVEL